MPRLQRGSVAVPSSVDSHNPEPAEQIRRAPLFGTLHLPLLVSHRELRHKQKFTLKQIAYEQSVECSVLKLCTAKPKRGRENMKLLHRCVTVAVLIIFLGSVCHAQERRSQPKDTLLSGQTVVDLTHPFDRNTIYWPTEDGFDLIRGKAGVTDKGYYYSANRFQGAEHGGTHVDAPIHFYKGRQTVDAIPIQRLIGEGIVVDVSEACAQDADYQITIEDLRRWETEHQRQLVNVIVLLRTGNGKHWQQRERYLGTAARGPEAVAQLHFPGLEPSAAQWLAEHRAIKAIGIPSLPLVS